MLRKSHKLKGKRKSPLRIPATRSRWDRSSFAYARSHVNLAWVRIPATTVTKKATRKGLLFVTGGAGGIRTHGALLPNGFRDRPVMTASILLRMCGFIKPQQALLYQDYFSFSISLLKASTTVFTAISVLVVIS